MYRVDVGAVVVISKRTLRLCATTASKLSVLPPSVSSIHLCSNPTLQRIALLDLSLSLQLGRPLLCTSLCCFGDGLPLVCNLVSLAGVADGTEGIRIHGDRVFGACLPRDAAGSVGIGARL